MRAAICALGAVALLMLTGCGHSENATEASPTPGSTSFDEHLSYTNTAGTRTYKVYVPASYSGAAAPLLVDLHGCGSDADEEARWSRFNAMAEQFGMLVVYPEQSPDANGSQCWNWFLTEHQSRDAGEPSIIADITREVMRNWNVDPRRVYLGGISAGGAMSVIMAVTYPDLYAAAMIYAGCEYKGTSCLGAVAALPAEVSGEMAYQAMGEHARVVPIIVIQGDTDPVVPSPNADLVVQQFLATDDWADNGANDASIPRERAGTWSDEKPGGHTYEVDEFRDAAGCLLAQRWLIHGMGHMWSNAEPDGSPRDALLTDPLGPDVSTPTLEFLLSHPMPISGPACFGE